MATIESATEIRPFQVDVPEEELDDLRRRIEATRWPERETVADQSQGAVPQFITEIDASTSTSSTFAFTSLRDERRSS